MDSRLAVLVMVISSLVCCRQSPAHEVDLLMQIYDTVGNLRTSLNETVVVVIRDRCTTTTIYMSPGKRMSQQAHRSSVQRYGVRQGHQFHPSTSDMLSDDILCDIATANTRLD
jgi:hypothetical protein